MNFGDFTITKREVIFSIVILAVMLTLGLMIHGGIDNTMMARHQEYNMALRIDNNTDMFEYGMSTNVGHAYVYGVLDTVDPVSFEEIDGEYSSITKVKERYTRHTRTVTKTRVVNGKTQTYTTTEVYWSWDRVDSWSDHSNKITFLGVEFDYGIFAMPSERHLETIKESSKIRYQYYGAPTKAEGTIYTDLRNNTINNSKMYYHTSIKDVHALMTSKVDLVIFWIVWIVLTGGAVFVFIYIDNHWLEDKRTYSRYRY